MEQLLLFLMVNSRESCTHFLEDICCRMDVDRQVLTLVSPSLLYTQLRCVFFVSS